MLDHARSAQGKSRRYRTLPCADRSWTSIITRSNSVLLAAKLECGSSFLSRVVVDQVVLEPSPRPIIIIPCVLFLISKSKNHFQAQCFLRQCQSTTVHLGHCCSPAIRYSPDNLQKSVIRWWRPSTDWGVIQSIITAVEKELRWSF